MQNNEVVWRLGENASMELYKQLVWSEIEVPGVRGKQPNRWVNKGEKHLRVKNKSRIRVGGLMEEGMLE